MSKSRGYIETALRHAEILVKNLPAGVRVIDVDVPGRLGRREYEATVHLYNADMKAIKENFNGSRVCEETMFGHPETLREYIVVDDMAIFQLKDNAAALSGTEDSGNEKDVT